MDTNNDEIERIFSQAADLCDVNVREAFLDTACGQNQPLRAAVERLLKHDVAGSFLEAAVVASPAVEQPAEQVGTMIGSYKLLEEIGEGGMGVVFMAEHRDVSARKVALKIIKPGLDTREVVGRFEAERQALAMMDHLNIARVLDAGTTESGRPYFVMELVDGIRLTEYCDQNQQDTRTRLALFISVCQAVQHAHQKGIIHRDIKPSNVMVTHHDGFPVPKIIDFGIAKAVHQRLTEKTAFTHFGQMIGTPLYMSPEQAERTDLDIDTRSDIYSLGVLLYELLTGTTPFDKERFKTASYDEICSIIREEDPPRPSDKVTTLGQAAETISSRRNIEPGKLGPLLRGELDWIVMTAMEKDRTRRYETATAFAQDVQRYLDDDPVEACPPSKIYRLRKSVRRHKTALTFAATIALLIVLGLVGTTWQAMVANDAKDLSDQRLVDVDEQRIAAEEQHARAEQHFQLAMSAVDAMLTEVGARDLADQPSMEPIRRALLEKALEFYVAFLEVQPDDPSVRVETARAHGRAGEILNLLGETQRAEKHYRQDIKILETLDEAVLAEHQYDLLQGLGDLGCLLFDLDRNAEAIKVAGRTISMAKELVASARDNSEYRQSLAKSLNLKGQASKAIGKGEEAKNAFKETIDVTKDLAADFPEDPEHRSSLAEYRMNLGRLLHEIGSVKEAEEALRASTTGLERLLDEFPDKPEYRTTLGLAYGNLSMLLEQTERAEEAETVVRESLEIHERLVRESPEVPRNRMSLASNLDALSGLLQDKESFEEAKTVQRRSLEIRKQLATEFPEMPMYRTDLAMSYINLANLLKTEDNDADCDDLYRKGIEVIRQLVAEFPTMPQHRDFLSMSYQNFAYSLMQSGHGQQAEKAFRESLQIGEQLAADFPDAPMYRDSLTYTLNNYGALLRREKRFEEAEKIYRQCLAILEQLAKEMPDVPIQEDIDKAKKRLKDTAAERTKQPAKKLDNKPATMP